MELTYRQLKKAFDPAKRILERVVEVPGVGNNPATQLDAGRLMPGLTRDVVVHTWDLARAVGADDRLDPGLCELCYAGVAADPAALSSSGMFNPPVAVDDLADVQSRLLALLGRDPAWRSADHQRP